MEQPRIIQDCNRLIEMPVLRFELRELQYGGCGFRGVLLGAPHLSKQLPRSIPTTCTSFQPRKIPSGERSSWLFRIAYPFLQFAAGWLALLSIQLVPILRHDKKKP